MAKHKDFTVATDVKVYSCDPQSPWQRGSNENTNGLLRQYFPKNQDLTDYSQSDLNKEAIRLNQRPRQTLGFQTPASKLQETVASTPLRPPGQSGPMVYATAVSRHRLSNLLYASARYIRAYRLVSI